MKQINKQNKNITLVFLKLIFHLFDTASSEVNCKCLKIKWLWFHYPHSFQSDLLNPKWDCYFY